MVLVKSVPTDMSAAAIGLNLIFSKLEEVQREEKKERTKRKKKSQKMQTHKERTKYIHKKCTHSWGWLWDRREGERKNRKHSSSHHRTQLEFLTKSDG